MSDVCRFPGCDTGQKPMGAYGTRLCFEHGCQANDELDRHRPPGEVLSWEQACGIVRDWLGRLRQEPIQLRPQAAKGFR